MKGKERWYVETGDDCFRYGFLSLEYVGKFERRSKVGTVVVEGWIGRKDGVGERFEVDLVFFFSAFFGRYCCRWCLSYDFYGIYFFRDLGVLHLRVSVANTSVFSHEHCRRVNYTPLQSAFGKSTVGHVSSSDKEEYHMKWWRLYSTLSGGSVGGIKYTCTVRGWNWDQGRKEWGKERDAKIVHFVRFPCCRWGDKLSWCLAVRIKDSSNSKDKIRFGSELRIHQCILHGSW